MNSAKYTVLFDYLGSRSQSEKCALAIDWHGEKRGRSFEPWRIRVGRILREQISSWNGEPLALLSAIGTSLQADPATRSVQPMSIQLLVPTQEGQGLILAGTVDKSGNTTVTEKRIAEIPNMRRLAGHYSLQQAGPIDKLLPRKGAALG